MISLVLMMRLISSIRSELTHTVEKAISRILDEKMANYQRTLFPDEGIISVVGIVCISRRCTPAIPQCPKIKLCLIALT
jgi:hypothetical protein